LQIVNAIRTSILGGPQKVTVYLDEFLTDFSFVENISLNEIALIKYVENFIMVPGNGPAILIYTKKGDDRGSIPSSVFNKFNFPGYSFTKEFYSPDYSRSDARDNAPDIRSTLYWNPYILLDKNKQIETIRFYNSDDCRKMRIVIEGFNQAGKLCRIEKIIGD
jgi:hypothetical protein